MAHYCQEDGAPNIIKRGKKFEEIEMAELTEERVREIVKTD